MDRHQLLAQFKKNKEINHLYEGYTLLQKSVLLDDPELVSLCLDKGASLEIENAWGLNALRLAELLNRQSVLALLGRGDEEQILFLEKDASEAKKIGVRALGEKLGFKYLNHLEFLDYKILEYIVDACHKADAEGKITVEKKNLGRLHRKSILRGHMLSIELKWIDDNIGYGVFAAEDIPAWSFIGEYTGTMQIKGEMPGGVNDYCFRYPTANWTNVHYLIDAGDTGNLTRMINHSESVNIKTISLYCQNTMHMILRSCEDIPKGSQLVYDYGQAYWKNRKKPELL